MQNNPIQAKRIADEGIYLNEDRYENTKEMFKFIAALIEKNGCSKAIDVLDVGCATGEFIYYLRKKFSTSKFTGIDVSKELIQQARNKMPTETWECQDILTSANEINDETKKQYDVVLCVGVLQIFDDITLPLHQLIDRVKSGGTLYIAGIFNSHPIDVITRYKIAPHVNNHQDWQLGWNLFSTQTYEASLEKIEKINAIQWQWHEFKMPFSIHKTNDFMRTWTLSTEHNPFQLTNGAAQLIDIKVLEIHK